MASFLKNNGDIILDAVLTDYGRKLLAKGDGSFNIVKFAFGDDEIDYGLFEPLAPTIDQDIEIMNTPILEAFTNNAASLKSKLLTLGMQNILYMPVMVANIVLSEAAIYQSDVFKGYVVPIDTNLNKTTNALSQSASAGGGIRSGVLSTGRYIIVDQGLDSDETDVTTSLKGTALYETAYNVYLDSKFGMINGTEPLSIDDDGIAVYKFTEQTTATNTSAVTQIVYDSNNDNNQIIKGTQGSRLKITITPSMNLNSDTYFNKYGKELVLNDAYQPSKTFKTLRMPLRIVGVTTGYTLELPVLFAKVNNP